MNDAIKKNVEMQENTSSRRREKNCTHAFPHFRGEKPNYIDDCAKLLRSLRTRCHPLGKFCRLADKRCRLKSAADGLCQNWTKQNR